MAQRAEAACPRPRRLPVTRTPSQRRRSALLALSACPGWTRQRPPLALPPRSASSPPRHPCLLARASGLRLAPISGRARWTRLPPALGAAQRRSSPPQLPHPRRQAYSPAQRTTARTLGRCAGKPVLTCRLSRPAASSVRSRCQALPPKTGAHWAAWTQSQALITSLRPRRSPSRPLSGRRSRAGPTGGLWA